MMMVMVMVMGILHVIVDVMIVNVTVMGILQVMVNVMGIYK